MRYHCLPARRVNYTPLICHPERNRRISYLFLNARDIIDAQKRPGADDSARFKLKEADHSLASAKWKARSTLSFGICRDSAARTDYHQNTIDSLCPIIRSVSTSLSPQQLSFPWFPFVHHIRAIRVTCHAVASSKADLRLDPRLRCSRAA